MCRGILAFTACVAQEFQSEVSFANQAIPAQNKCDFKLNHHIHLWNTWLSMVSRLTTEKSRICQKISQYSKILARSTMDLFNERTVTKNTVTLFSKLTLHCKKSFNFPVPSRDVTSQTIPGREKLNYSRPGRVWIVTSRLGTGKPLTFFNSVKYNNRT